MSVLMTSVWYPSSALRRAVAADSVVLPTPPLPVKRIVLTLGRGKLGVDRFEHRAPIRVLGLIVTQYLELLAVQL